MAQNISGLSVSNAQTGQTIVSTCAGAVRMHHGAGATNDYSTAAGVGLRCTDSTNGDYQAGSFPAEAAGAITLTVTSTGIFLQDNLHVASGVNLGTRQAAIGGTWSAQSHDLVGNSTSDGVLGNSNTNTCRSQNTIVPPQADYRVEATFHKSSGSTVHTLSLLLHWDDAAGNGYRVAWNTNGTTVALLKITGGTPTSLGTGGSLGVGDNLVEIRYKAGTLSVKVGGTTVISVSESTYPNAGKVAIQDLPSGIPTGNSWMFGLTAQTV